MPTLEEIQDESYKAGRPLNEKDDEDDWDDEDSEILVRVSCLPLCCSPDPLLTQLFIHSRTRLLPMTRTK